MGGWGSCRHQGEAGEESTGGDNGVCGFGLSVSLRCFIPSCSSWQLYKFIALTRLRGFLDDEKLCLCAPCGPYASWPLLSLISPKIQKVKAVRNAVLTRLVGHGELTPLRAALAAALACLPPFEGLPKSMSTGAKSIGQWERVLIEGRWESSTSSPMQCAYLSWCSA